MITINNYKEYKTYQNILCGLIRFGNNRSIGPLWTSINNINNDKFILGK